jgi:hypothetical protein
MLLSESLGKNPNLLKYNITIEQNLMQPYENPEIISYSNLLSESFLQLTGQPLLVSGSDLAKKLYEAPFALISHGIQVDPIFFYANQTAQKLWQMTWDEFVVFPSRLSVETMLQEERDRLLKEAQSKGYIDNFEGIRITKNGHRFKIQDAVLWNVMDSEGVQHGQACIIRRWDFV